MLLSSQHPLLRLLGWSSPATRITSEIRNDTFKKHEATTGVLRDVGSTLFHGLVLVCACMALLVTCADLTTTGDHATSANDQTLAVSSPSQKLTDGRYAGTYRVSSKWLKTSTRLMKRPTKVPISPSSTS